MFSPDAEPIERFIILTETLRARAQERADASVPVEGRFGDLDRQCQDANEEVIRSLDEVIDVFQAATPTPATDGDALGQLRYERELKRWTELNDWAAATLSHASNSGLTLEQLIAQLPHDWQ